ncbi:MAG: anti-sigma regulatory factor [Myxococcota bacterium]
MTLPPSAQLVLVPINGEWDVVTARQEARAVAVSLGFGGTLLTVIATAVSEIARNIVNYAGRGEVGISIVESGGRRGIEIVARDTGPGIPDIALAMQDGYSTGRGLGLGLPGARRLMDDFHIESTPGKGTCIVMRKWRK